MTTTLPSVTAFRASDLDYSVSCGQCPESAGEPRTATHVVGYDSTDLDGDPIGERLFTCTPCFGETYVWAETHNRGFVPVTVDRIQPARAPVSVPACQFCGAEFHACETTFRGLCVQMPVSA